METDAWQAINAERKIEEQLAALEERAAREAKVASDLLQEQHRAENEQREATRNAERELVRTAALEKKTRTDQVRHGRLAILNRPRVGPG